MKPSEERTSGKSDSNSQIHSGVERRAALRKPGSSEDKKLSPTLLREEDSRTLPPAMSNKKKQTLKLRSLSGICVCSRNPVDRSG